jgi:hypothetical protein
VRLRIVFAIGGGIGQVEFTGELGQVAVAADGEQDGFSAELLSKGERFIGAAEQLALPLFTNEQCFHRLPPI